MLGILVNKPERVREREREQRGNSQRGNLHSILFRMNRGRKKPERACGLLLDRLWVWGSE